MKTKRQKRLIGLICALVLIITGVSVYWHQEMSYAERLARLQTKPRGMQNPRG